MVINEALSTIVKSVIDRQLGSSIAHLESYLFTFVQPQASEQLNAIKTDYQLMSSYWQQGYDDDQRQKLYDQLLRRMYVLTMNIGIRYSIRQSAFLTGIHSRARLSRKEWSAAALRRDLVDYVSDVALLELEPEHTRRQHRQAIYAQHQQMMEALFDYVWTSRLWTDGVTDAFEEMLLTPTIDSADQQLMVSAITLSLLNFFGINKFRLLINVYRQSADERVRQRALVGWAFCLNADVARLYPEMNDMVRDVLSDDLCLNELAELQMQVFYCLQAENDNKIIQSEIMPELMKSGNLRVTRNGIEEVDDDTMEDVLHPELSEQRMEKLEASMKRMADMQRQGSDIYFGGFSQMKRFPFFQTVANWFVPFYLEHPAVEGITDGVRGRKFLLSLLKTGPFCDSDKYSFLLGYQAAVSRIPESLLEMMDRGEAVLVGSEIDTSELQTPAFLRRSYLQNLYRFFRVYPQRSEFVNPFDTTAAHPRYLFFANSLLQQTRAEEKLGEVSAFLLKNHACHAAMMTLQNYREEVRDAQFYLLNGTVLSRTHTEQNAGLTVAGSYARLLELDPQNERGWAGYARAMFDSGDYQAALAYYRRLTERHPDRRNYLLNEAVCLTKLNEYGEALKLLYRLNYEAPDDANVTRVLAWTLVGDAKYDAASKFYQALLSSDTVLSDDLLNYGYCLWFSRSITAAAGMFRRYASQPGVSFSAMGEFFGPEHDFICRHGVSDVEIRLMADLLEY